MVSFFLIYYFSKHELSGEDVLVSYSIGYGATGIISLIALLYSANDIAGFTKINEGQFLKSSFWIMLGSIFVLLFSEAQLWLLKYYSNNESVIEFSVGLRVTSVLLIPIPLIGMVIQKDLANLIKNGEIKLAEKLLKVSAIYSSVLLGIVAILIFCFSPEIVSLFKGQMNKNCIYLIRTLCALYLFVFLLGFPGVALMMAGFERSILKFAIVSLLVTLPIVYLTIDSMGSMASAVGFCLTLILHKLMMVFHLKRSLSINCVPWIADYEREVKKIIKLYLEKKSIAEN